MAFFGLTALGPQNPFHVAQDPPLSVFSEEEMTTAWGKIAQQNDVIAFSQLEPILRALYRCPDGIESPQEILASVNEAFQGKDYISLNEYVEGMNQLREQMQPTDGKYYEKTCEYKSNEEYRASLHKHARNGKGPKEKYGKPLTDSQALGWGKPQDLPKRLPKQSCAETKFASAMVQAGVYY